MNPAYTLQDGVLLYREEKSLWVLCPKDGKVSPQTEMVRNFDLEGEPFGGEMMLRPSPSLFWAKLLCSVCGQLAPKQEYRLTKSKRDSGRCDARCLEATGDECSCRCLGKCHGGGECSCGVAVGP